MMELVDEELSKIISKDENNGQNTVHSSIKEFPWESKKDRWVYLLDIKIQDNIIFV